MKIHLRNIYTKPPRQKCTPKTEILTLVATQNQVFRYCNKLTNNKLAKRSKHPGSLQRGAGGAKALRGGGLV